MPTKKAAHPGASYSVSASSLGALHKPHSSIKENGGVQAVPPFLSKSMMALWNARVGLSLMITAVGLALPCTAQPQAKTVSDVDFVVLDSFGRLVPYRVRTFADARSEDFSPRFSGLSAKGLPRGRYLYRLERTDLKNEHAVLRGEVDLVRSEHWFTLFTDPTLLVSAQGTLAIERNIPLIVTIRGRLEPPPNQTSRNWVRLQSLHGSSALETAVDSLGGFTIRQPLDGPYLVLVFYDGVMVGSQLVFFHQGASVQNLAIHLPDKPPSVVTVR